MKLSLTVRRVCWFRQWMARHWQARSKPCSPTREWLLVLAGREEKRVAHMFSAEAMVRGESEVYDELTAPIGGNGATGLVRNRFVFCRAFEITL